MGQHESIINSPLSRLQHALYYVCKTNSDNPAYNVPLTYKISGELDLSKVRDAITYIYKRHPILSTRIIELDHEIIQQIDLNAIPDISIKSYINDQTITEAQCLKSINQFLNTPVNLDTNALFKVKIYQLGPSLNYIAFLFHHIICDADSIALFEEEFIDILEKNINNQLDSEKKIEINYYDFTKQLNSIADTENYREKLHYWQDRLNSPPLYSGIPNDITQTDEKTGSAKVVDAYINKTNTTQLRNICKTCGVTMYTIFLSSLYLVIRKYLYQDDIIVGCPVSCRNLFDDKNSDSIGYFINTLPVRLRVNNNYDNTEILNHVQNSFLKDLMQREVLFDEIVRHSSFRRCPNLTPLFQILLNYQRVQIDTKSVANTEITFVPNEVTGSKFDLNILIEDQNDSIYIQIVYDSGKYSEPYAKDILESLIEMTIGFTRSARLLPYLHRSYMPVNDLNEYHIRNSIHNVAAISPTKVAIETSTFTMDYQTLDQLTNKLAKYITEKVSANKIVGISSCDHIKRILLVISVIKSNNSFVYIDTQLPELRKNFIVDDTGLSAIIVGNKVDAEKFMKNTNINIVNYDHIKESVNTFSDELITLPIEYESVGYVTYTSGSTGTPKGVKVQNKVILNLVSWYTSNYNDSGKLGQFASLSFDMSMLEIFSTLYLGNTLFLFNDAEKTQAGYLVNNIHKFKINTMMLPVVMLNEILGSHENIKPLESLRHIISAGEQLYLSDSAKHILKALPNCKLSNFYGPCETHVVTAYQVPVSFYDTQDALRVPIGKQITNCIVTLVKDCKIISADGQVNPNEIVIGGLPQFYGYTDGRLNRGKFITLNYKGCTQVFYRTGDLGEYNDGNLIFVSRIDRQVKIRGYRVELVEIEHVLMQLPQIQNVVVQFYESEHPLNNYIFATIETNTDLDISLVKSYLNERLPDYMIPKKIYIENSLPKGITGKVDKKSIYDKRVNYSAASTIDSVLQGYIEKVKTIWEEILDETIDSIDDDFFELGGHSLLFTRMLININSTFSVDIPFEQIIKEPTIINLAKYILGENSIPGGRINNVIQEDIDIIVQKVAARIESMSPIKYESVNKPKVLLTGANGFLGVNILASLIAASEADVYCLIRSDSFESGQAKLKHALSEYNISITNAEDRIKIVIGDISQKNLGVNNADYKMLIREITHIIHNGAQVNHIYSYNQLRKTNVNSLYEIIKLSTSDKLKRISYISSLAANNRVLSNRIYEVLGQAEPTGIENGYVQTKWVCEQILAKCVDYGLQIYVFRPGFIIGSRSDGAFNYENNHIAILIKTCILFRQSPSWSHLLNLVPVDVAAECIVKFSLFENHSNLFYNLCCSSEDINWQDIIATLVQTGYEVEYTQQSIWLQNILSNIGTQDPMFKLIPLYSSSVENNDVPSVDCQNTNRLAKELGIKNYEITKEDLYSLINFLRKKAFIKSIKTECLS